VANHKSALKRSVQNEKKRLLNKSKKSKVKTAIKQLRAAIKDGNKEQAQNLMVEAQAGLAKLAKTNTVKKASASRQTARLAAQVAKI